MVLLERLSIIIKIFVFIGFLIKFSFVFKSIIVSFWFCLHYFIIKSIFIHRYVKGTYNICFGWTSFMSFILRTSFLDLQFCNICLEATILKANFRLQSQDSQADKPSGAKILIILVIYLLNYLNQPTFLNGLRSEIIIFIDFLVFI